MASKVKANLSLATTQSVSSIIRVPNGLSVAHVQGYSATWTSAVVEVKKSVFNEQDSDALEDTVHHFISFATARTMTASQQAIEFLPVVGILFLRLETTTAEPAAAGNAKFMVTFS